MWLLYLGKYIIVIIFTFFDGYQEEVSRDDSSMSKIKPRAGGIQGADEVKSVSYLHNVISIQ
jgi:hypothetical protein